VAVEMPFEQAEAVVMTLPRLLASAVRQKTGDQEARYVFGLHGWAIEGVKDQQCLIATLKTMDGFEVCFGIPFEVGRVFGCNLQRIAEGALEASIGPVGIITPWNTPFMLSTWKIAPALAAGCTVVHKPAELAPLTARLLVEIAEEAGIPPGVWNVVNGMGEDAGKALTEHPDIKAIGFVGESRTGSLIMRQGSDTLKRVHFELGGKNPVIVFADADLERAADEKRFSGRC
jgi:hypothetical protein